LIASRSGTKSKAHPDLRAALGGRHDVDPLGDPADQRQPEAEARAVGARRHPHAVVGDRQHERVAAVMGLHRDDAGPALAVGVHDAVRHDLRHGEQHVAEPRGVGSAAAQPDPDGAPRLRRGAPIGRERVAQA
jgi:hypothetical protein